MEAKLFGAPQSAFESMGSVLESSGEYSVIATDLDGGILRWNEGARRAYGYDAGEVVGLATIGLLFNAAERAADRPRQIFEAALCHGQWEGVLERVRKSGEQFPARVALTPRRDEAGAIVGFLTISKDISEELRLSNERETAARSLREARQRLEGLVASAMDAIITVDECQRITLFNPAAERMFDYRAGEVMGKPLDLLLPERFRALHRSQVGAYGQSGRTVRNVHTFIVVTGLRRDGTELPLEVSISRDTSTGRPSFTAILRDVSERIQAQAQIKESELRFRQIAESIDEIFFLVDPALTRVIYLSPAYEKITGRSRDAAYADARSFMAHIHPDDRERVIHEVMPLGSLIPFDVNCRMVRVDGAVIWIRARGFPIRDDAGMVYRFAGVAAETTRQVHLEAMLREREAGLRRAQLVAKLAHVVASADGSFESWSDTMPALVGVAPADAPKSRAEWMAFIHPGDREAARESFAQSRQEARASFEYRLRRGDDRWITVHQEIETIEVAGQVHWFSTIQDITEQKRVEETIRRLNVELEQRVVERTAELQAANKELESFDYSISHDLRAPVRRIQGFADALLKTCSTELGEQGRAHLQRIVNASETMEELVDDLFALSTSTKGEMRLANVELADLSREILAGLQRASPQRQVEIVVHPRLEARADPGLARILLENLLGNAWKFTSRATAARIEVGCVERDGVPVFFVRDNGAGFDMTRAERLFMPFQRMHARSDFDGTGIGLATVQRIINRHGGSIRAEAAVGKGATFHFTLAAVGLSGNSTPQVGNSLIAAAIRAS